MGRPRKPKPDQPKTEYQPYKPLPADVKPLCLTAPPEYDFSQRIQWNKVWKPEIPSLLLDHMSKGLSLASFCGLLQITPTTLARWVDEYPEFAEVKEIGYYCSLLFWEQQGIEGMQGNIAFYNAATWIYNMKCRFRKEGWNVEAEALGGATSKKVVVEDLSFASI